VSACSEKHTKFQPADDQWRCPKCGEDNKHFYIEESVGVGDCEKLHADDYALCMKCEYHGNGTKVANAIAKKCDLVPCEHCKGTGQVPKKRGAP
jgi:hypothetical protein